MNGVACRRAAVDDIPAMRRFRLAVTGNASSNPARIAEPMYRGDPHD